MKKMKKMKKTLKIEKKIGIKIYFMNDKLKLNKFLKC